MTRPIPVSFIMLAISFCALAFDSYAQVVRFSEVNENQLQPRKRVVGTLKAFNQAQIASSESGKVVKVLVNEGDLVAKGDILAVLDTRRLNAELARLEAEKALAQANLELAKAEFTQSEKDYLAYKASAQKSAVSEQRLAQSKTKTIANQARVIAADQAIKALIAQRQAMQVRIDDMQIRAPFNGQVTHSYTELGQWLGSGDNAFTLTSLNKLEVWLDVPERFAALSKNTPTTIALQIGNELIQATNIKVLNSVDQRARTFRVIGELENTHLMPGMSVSAWLPEGEARTTLTVPKDALVKRGGNYLVYQVVVQDDKQMAQPVNVNVLFHQGNSVAIYAPQLNAQDKVVTEGNERLMPGPVMAVADSSNANQQHLK